MASLDLFPPRIAFVDDQGRLTPEAYRSLRSLNKRVDVVSGDQGSDTFSVFSSQGDTATHAFDLIVQGAEPMPIPDPMVLAQPSTGSAIATITPGASPYAWTAAESGTMAISGGTVTAITITRSGTTAALGILAGAIPVSTGDLITTTYTVAPAMAFIPR